MSTSEWKEGTKSRGGACEISAAIGQKKRKECTKKLCMQRKSFPVLIPLQLSGNIRFPNVSLQFKEVQEKGHLFKRVACLTMTKG